MDSASMNAAVRRGVGIVGWIHSAWVHKDGYMPRGLHDYGLWTVNVMESSDGLRYGVNDSIEYDWPDGPRVPVPDLGDKAIARFFRRGDRGFVSYFPLPLSSA
jgi:hypothetical protein